MNLILLLSLFLIIGNLSFVFAQSDLFSLIDDAEIERIFVEGGPSGGFNKNWAGGTVEQKISLIDNLKKANRKKLWDLLEKDNKDNILEITKSKPRSFEKLFGAVTDKDFKVQGDISDLEVKYNNDNNFNRLSIGKHTIPLDKLPKEVNQVLVRTGGGTFKTNNIKYNFGEGSAVTGEGSYITSIFDKDGKEVSGKIAAVTNRGDGKSLISSATLDNGLLNLLPGESRLYDGASAKNIQIADTNNLEENLGKSKFIFSTNPRDLRVFSEKEVTNEHPWLIAEDDMGRSYAFTSFKMLPDGKGVDIWGHYAEGGAKGTNLVPLVVSTREGYRDGNIGNNRRVMELTSFTDANGNKVSGFSTNFYAGANNFHGGGEFVYDGRSISFGNRAYVIRESQGNPTSFANWNNGYYGTEDRVSRRIFRRQNGGIYSRPYQAGESRTRYGDLIYTTPDGRTYNRHNEEVRIDNFGRTYEIRCSLGTCTRNFFRGIRYGAQDVGEFAYNVIGGAVDTSIYLVEGTARFAGRVLHTAGRIITAPFRWLFG